MSTVLGCPQLDHITETTPLPDELVRRQVWGILAGLYPPGKTAERRIDQRFPFPQLLYLTPVGGDGISPAGDPVVVVGKHLSERGLGFFYQQPLPYRPSLRTRRRNSTARCRAVRRRPTEKSSSSRPIRTRS